MSENGYSENADQNLQEPVDLSGLFRIGEVSRLTGTKPFVLRYWETEFPMLQPVKSPKGHRLYRKQDVDTVLLIKRLLYDDGFTIAGARRHLHETGGAHSESAEAGNTSPASNAHRNASPSAEPGADRRADRSGDPGAHPNPPAAVHTPEHVSASDSRGDGPPHSQEQSLFEQSPAPDSLAGAAPPMTRDLEPHGEAARLGSAHEASSSAAAASSAGAAGTAVAPAPSQPASRPVQELAGGRLRPEALVRIDRAELLDLRDALRSFLTLLENE